ncbi:hypothetical protein [Rhabdothermincola sediminis]|uniref:hypothetical protein n=1 Tax=Rhabdothermincola sediminis TaxID=2751370 RepID=UPI001AA081B6|nr:hypothetical protein [Rhabdothermincola sediminis]
MSKIRVVLASGLLACLLGACASGSGSEDQQASQPPSPTPPSSTGDTCSDPANDLALDPGMETGTGGLEGIDLTTASATLEGDQLVVRFVTNGDIAAVPSPTFVVAQGDPFGPFSFELRASRDDTTSTWTVTLITWSQREERRPIPTDTTVAADTLSFRVPAESLPPIANYLSFGATAKVGDELAADDCSNLFPTTTGG